MSFGVDSPGILSRTTSATVEVVKRLNTKGEVIQLRSTGGVGEITISQYTDDYVNEAINGQSGEDLISSHELIESNKDYARETKTKMVALAVS